MKAALIDQRRFTAIARNGAIIFVHMDLFKVSEKEAPKHPGGYRFSWIAFNAEDPKKKVLFDSHPPKGAHFHIDGDKKGVSFVWESAKQAEALFFAMVAAHFNIDPEELQ